MTALINNKHEIYSPWFITREMNCQQLLPRPARASQCRPELRQLSSCFRASPPKLITMNLGAYRVSSSTLLALIFLALFIGHTAASLGDHLPDFKECVQVSFPQVQETLARV